MADNTLLNAGSGGDTISTDDLGGGVKVQRVKVQFGVDGSATDVAAAAPLPIQITDGTDNALVSASGALSVDTELPAAAALSDSFANPTTAPVGAMGMVWNGTNWERFHSFNDTAILTSGLNLTVLNATTNLTVPSLGSFSGVAIFISGFGTGTVTFEGSVDGTNYFAVGAAPVGGGDPTTTATGNGQWQASIAGFANFRVRVSITGTGTATVSIHGTRADPGVITFGSPLPTGTNTIGRLTSNQSVNVNQISGTGVSVNTGNASAGTQRVVLASDQPAVATTSQTAGTATTSSVAGNASSVQLLAANAGRLGATIVNDSTAIAYVKCGTTASNADYTVKLQPDDYWEMPFKYTGRIDAIWASAAGNARITEFSA